MLVGSIPTALAARWRTSGTGREACRLQVTAFADRPEHWTLRDPGRVQPLTQGADRAGRRVTPESDEHGAASAGLIGLGFRDLDEEPRVVIAEMLDVDPDPPDLPAPSHVPRRRSAALRAFVMVGL